MNRAVKLPGIVGLYTDLCVPSAGAVPLKTTVSPKS